MTNIPKEQEYIGAFLYRFYLGRFKQFKGKVSVNDNYCGRRKFYDETNGNSAVVSSVEGIIDGNDVWFKEPNLEEAIRLFIARENRKIEKAKQKISYYQSQIKILEEIER